MKREFSAYLLLLSASTSVLSFVIPLYLKSVAGLGDADIGFMFTIANLVSTVMLVVASAHSDVAGLKKYLMAFSASIVAASLVLFVPAAYFLVFLVSLTLVSLVSKSFYVFGKIIAISRFTGEMAHVYGIFGVAISAGALLGPILGGNVVDSFGFHSSFLLSGAIAAISALALSAMSDKGGRKQHSKRGFLKSLVDSFIAFRFTIQSLALVVYRTLLQVGFTMFSGFVLPLFMSGEFPDFFLAGLAVSAFSLGRMAGFGLGNYTDRHDFNKVNLISLVLQSAFVLAFSFTGGWTSVFFLALSGVASGLAATALPGFYSRISSKLGRDIGLIDTLGLGIGSAIGAYLSGILASQFGYRSVFMWGALIGLLAALFIYPFFRKNQALSAATRS